MCFRQVWRGRKPWLLDIGTQVDQKDWFVTFTNEESAAGRRLDGTELDGRPIKVNIARSVIVMPKPVNPNNRRR